jgi:hypothetical protein
LVRDRRLLMLLGNGCFLRRRDIAKPLRAHNSRLRATEARAPIDERTSEVTAWLVLMGYA